MESKAGKRGKSPGGYPSRGYPWSDEQALQPLTLSLSLWERDRVRGDAPGMTRHAQRPRVFAGPAAAGKCPDFCPSYKSGL